MCQLPKTKEELDEYIKQAQRLKWKEEKRAYRKRLKEKSITHKDIKASLDGENIK